MQGMVVANAFLIGAYTLAHTSAQKCRKIGRKHADRNFRKIGQMLRDRPAPFFKSLEVLLARGGAVGVCDEATSRRSKIFFCFLLKKLMFLFEKESKIRVPNFGIFYLFWGSKTCPSIGRLPQDCFFFFQKTRPSAGLLPQAPFL